MARIFRTNRPRFPKRPPALDVLCSVCGVGKSFHAEISGQCPYDAARAGRGEHTFFHPPAGTPLMTAEQKTFARALAAVDMPPDTGTKRFALSMRLRAERPNPAALTERQAEYLRSAVVRYREQIPVAVVALAESIAPQSIEQKGSAA